MDCRPQVTVLGIAEDLRGVVLTMVVGLGFVLTLLVALLGGPAVADSVGLLAAIIALVWLAANSPLVLPGARPVFWRELRGASRSWMPSTLRTGVATLALAALAVLYANHQPADLQESEQYANLFAVAVLLTGTATVLIAGPALAASAFRQHLERGTFDALRLTPVSTRELVSGLLTSRLAHLLNVVLALAPFLAIAPVIGGGIDPLGALLGGVAMAGLALAIGAIALDATLASPAEQASAGLNASMMGFGCVFLTLFVARTTESFAFGFGVALMFAAAILAWVTGRAVNRIDTGYELQSRELM